MKCQVQLFFSHLHTGTVLFHVLVQHSQCCFVQFVDELNIGFSKIQFSQCFCLSSFDEKNFLSDPFQPTQTELVLKVFLRLVEDIIIFQNLHHKRRRDIVNALSMNNGEIMELFINLLQEHTNKAKALVSACSLPRYKQFRRNRYVHQEFGNLKMFNLSTDKQT